MQPKSFISKKVLSENIRTLWQKYDRNHNNKLELDEFKDLLSGCARNWGYKIAVKAVGSKIYKNLKTYSKNKEDALSKQDIFTFAQRNNIKINEQDSIDTLIDANMKSLNKVMT